VALLLGPVPTLGRFPRDNPDHTLDYTNLATMFGSSQGDGIQALLAAEQEAQQIVGEARRGRRPVAFMAALVHNEQHNSWQ